MQIIGVLYTVEKLNKPCLIVYSKAIFLIEDKKNSKGYFEAIQLTGYSGNSVTGPSFQPDRKVKLYLNAESLEVASRKS